MKKSKISLAVLFTAVVGLGSVVLSEGDAKSAYCTTGSISACYSYFSFLQSKTCDYKNAKWCERVNPTGTFWYTKVDYRNWGSYSEVGWAAEKWNAGYVSGYGGNSLGFIASTASSNDVDIENVYNSSVAWWGIATMPGGVNTKNTSGTSDDCFNANAGNVKLNTYHIGGSAFRRRHTALHELGHEIGLGHVSTSHNMNPNGSKDVLDDCDELGAETLYP